MMFVKGYLQGDQLIQRHPKCKDIDLREKGGEGGGDKMVQG